MWDVVSSGTIKTGGKYLELTGKTNVKSTVTNLFDLGRYEFRVKSSFALNAIFSLNIISENRETTFTISDRTLSSTIINLVVNGTGTITRTYEVSFDASVDFHIYAIEITSSAMKLCIRKNHKKSETQCDQHYLLAKFSL